MSMGWNGLWENSDDRTTVRPNLVGSIVTELTQLPQLELLDLSHNNLKGNTLHDTFLSLRILQLQYNALSGTIPFNFVGSGK
mmetsp:Transcript_23275/g.23512  ORF Transcript_23275/g.23512 Transcript_23275/m.23512 type:complete len:82 (-) Transcript_23275:254-499(-)